MISIIIWAVGSALVLIAGMLSLFLKTLDISDSKKIFYFCMFAMLWLPVTIITAIYGGVILIYDFLYIIINDAYKYITKTKYCAPS